MGLEEWAGPQGPQASPHGLCRGCGWPAHASHREAWVLQCAKQKQKQNLAPPLLFSPPQMKDAIFLPQSPASGSGSIKSPQALPIPAWPRLCSHFWPGPGGLRTEVSLTGRWAQHVLVWMWGCREVGHHPLQGHGAGAVCPAGYQGPAGYRGSPLPHLSAASICFSC